MRLEVRNCDFPQLRLTAGGVVGLPLPYCRQPRGAAPTLSNAPAGLTRLVDARPGLTLSLDECGVIPSHGKQSADAATGGLQG